MEERWISGFASSFRVGDAFMEKLRTLYVGLEHVRGLEYHKVTCFSDYAELVDVVMGDKVVGRY